SLLIRRHLRSALFPYTTLFRSGLGTCLCTMSCGSWLQFSTPNDDKRLSQEMDLLEACLKGTFTDRTLPTEKDIAQNRDGNTGSQDRKSTRLNSSHVAISYAVFC